MQVLMRHLKMSMMINMNIFYEITLDKNLFSNNSYGTLDLQSNLKFIITILTNLQFWLMILIGILRI